MGQFTVRINPDIVDGDISKLIAADKTDTPFGASDLLFEWQALQIPKGACTLQNIVVYMLGEDGGVQADRDLYFMFAKTVDGVAPGTLGEENSAMTACFELPLHLIGACKLEATGGGAGHLLGPAFGNVMHTGIGGAQGPDTPIVLQGEPDSGQNVGYDAIYVACFTGGALDFSTGIESTGAISAGASATIAVDEVDARKCFQKGDAVYIHDVDTKAGTVLSVAEGSIVLDAVTAAAVANNDEIINGSPIKVTFGFTN